MSEEKRREKRVFVFCRILDENENFLGYALDLTKFGVKIMVQSNMEQKDEFDIKMLAPDKDNPISVDVKIKVVWRNKRSEQFDELGAEFAEVKDKEKFDTFITYFKSVAEKYSLEI